LIINEMIRRCGSVAGFLPAPASGGGDAGVVIKR
jgi:hypothetical protein